MKISEKYTPFELEPILLYDKDTYKIVAGKAYTNKDEKILYRFEIKWFFSQFLSYISTTI
ncbi:hypothetical protein AAID95_07585 [Campylobacter coli]